MMKGIMVIRARMRKVDAVLATQEPGWYLHRYSTYSSHSEPGAERTFIVAKGQRSWLEPGSGLQLWQRAGARHVRATLLARIHSRRKIHFILREKIIYKYRVNWVYILPRTCRMNATTSMRTRREGDRDEIADAADVCAVGPAARAHEESG